MRARLAAALLAALLAGCSDAPTDPLRLDPQASAGSWATWVLPAGSSLRPPPPPEVREEELQEIVRVQRDPAAVEAARVQHWAASPTTLWTNEAIDLLEWYWALLPDVRVASPANSARIMALLHVAMHDALVASWDAKYAYRRPPPHAADPRVRALVEDREVPSYPSEHAAAGAAAAAVLAYAFPMEDAGRFQALAREAGESRVAAGMAYPSDVEAGLALGRQVAERVLRRAAEDGSSAAWDGAIPEGDHVWRPTPARLVEVPFDPMAGRWRPWVIADGSAFRPAPPPLPGSARFEADLEELRRMPVDLTREQSDAARYWATDAPSAWWELFAAEEIARRDLHPLHAARAHALVSVVMYDAFVAAWDAKFHYWLLRPITADPSLGTVFSTPPFPSYPSGHSTMSAAAAEVFAYLFPDRAEYYHAKAHEASVSRIWGGVHYRFDCEVGAEMGARIGAAVVEWAREREPTP